MSAACNLVVYILLSVDNDILILSHVWSVSIDEVWISNWIYCTLCDTVCDYTLHFTITNTLVTVLYSLLLLGSGFQWWIFPFLWVFEVFQASAASFSQ
jgi:hypothetical protein